MSSSEIPVVNLSPMQASGEGRDALARELRDICHTVGFFVITQHGIDPALVEGVFGHAERFFALPTEQKAQIDKSHSPHFRGWEPAGTERTNGRPDIREQIDIWSEHAVVSAPGGPDYLRLLGPNQWLSEQVMPGFRATMTEWFEQLGGLADELLCLLEQGLGLPAGEFSRRFGEQQMSLTKVISYPPTPTGAFGVNAHHDTGFLTLLATGAVPGLQVLSPGGDWVDVPVVEDSFVVNIGEMLQAMTGNYLLATPHRVVTRSARRSLGYFHGPALDTPLTLLPMSADLLAQAAASPRHSTAGYMARREETEQGVGDMQSSYRADVYGQQLWNYFARSYPQHVERHYPS